MDEVAEKTEFRFEELEGYAKDAAREWLMGTFDYDWWDCVYRDFIEARTAEGFRMDAGDISFQLSYCQGDYAYFKGNINLQEFAEAKPEFFRTLPMLAAAQADLLDTAQIETYGHREYINGVSIAYRWDDYPPDGTAFDGLDAESFWALIHDDAIRDLETDLKEYCKGLCSELYDALRSEWEGMTTDEALKELANANEWLFDEDGSLV